jgi:hypothetical protein
LQLKVHRPRKGPKELIIECTKLGCDYTIRVDGCRLDCGEKDCIKENRCIECRKCTKKDRCVVIREVAGTTVKFRNVHNPAAHADDHNQDGHLSQHILKLAESFIPDDESPDEVSAEIDFRKLVVPDALLPMDPGSADAAGVIPHSSLPSPPESSPSPPLLPPFPPNGSHHLEYPDAMEAPRSPNLIHLERPADIEAPSSPSRTHLMDTTAIEPANTAEEQGARTPTRTAGAPNRENSTVTPSANTLGMLRSPSLCSHGCFCFRGRAKISDLVSILWFPFDSGFNHARACVANKRTWATCVEKRW